MVTVPIRQLCTESTEFREKLFKTFIPRRQEPEPESENNERCHNPATARRNPTGQGQPRREVQNEDDSESGGKRLSKDG